MKLIWSHVFAQPVSGLLLRLLGIVLVLSMLLPASAAHAAAPQPVLDQSFTDPGGASVAINDCCRYVAQTFTAGMTGALTAVSLDIASASSFFLRVSIQDTTDGLPNGTVLSQVYVWGTDGAPKPDAPLTLLIDVGTVYVQTGRQYAIVVDYDGSGAPGHTEGSWLGASGDHYSGGAAYTTNDETFSDWNPAGDAGTDLHFKTYVVPNVPVSDLSVAFDSGSRNSKACQVFEEHFTIHNAGPDPAEHVVLGIGVTDQFDVVTVDGNAGSMTAPLQLQPGETVQLTALIKTTAFVPGESRDGRFMAHVYTDVWPDIVIDPNGSNDYYGGAVRLISKPVLSCPR